MSQSMPTLQSEEPYNTCETPADDKNNGSPRKDSFIDNILKDQKNIDPVQKGPFLSVDNSPHSNRNVNVIKAKLREQESRHMLEMVRLKKEYEAVDEKLNAESSALRDSITELQAKLDAEIKLREDVTRRDEQSSKELLVISGKCAELQGRLDESHAALQETRAHIETLHSNHQSKLAEIRKEIGESEEKHYDVKRALELKIRDLEDQRTETLNGFQRSIAEKIEQWKSREAEMLEGINSEKTRCEKLTRENHDLNEKCTHIEMELRETFEGQLTARSELRELKEFHSMELIQLREDQTKLELELNEQLKFKIMELQQARDELDVEKSSNEELIAEKANIIKKHEESVKVLKDALTVLDEQNKELTVEVKRVLGIFEEKENLCATLTSLIEELQIKIEKSESEKKELLMEKSKLEEQLTTKTQKLTETISSKDAEISKIQEDLHSAQSSTKIEMQEKDNLVHSLELTLEGVKLSMAQEINAKDVEIRELAKNLDEERSKAAFAAQEITRLAEKTQSVNAQLDSINGKYEIGKQQIVKLNLEMSRLINEVVNIKEENIDLKSGLNEALQKGEFYKDRNYALTEQLAEMQREKADKEAELLADIEEKKTLIDYLQCHATAATTTGGSEKKRRRFFQTKTIPTSPMKIDSAKFDGPVEDST